MSPDPRPPEPGIRTGPDLRLFGAAAGTWAATLVALYLTAPAGLAVATGAGAGALVLAWWARREPGRLRVWRWPGAVRVRPARRRRRARSSPARWSPAHADPSTRSDRWRAVVWAVAAAVLGLGCGAAATAARVWLRDGDPIASLARAHATAEVELTITADPRLLADARPGTYLVAAELDRIVHDDRLTLADARVVVFADPAWRGFLPSQRIATRARFAPARGGDLTSAALTAIGTPRPLAGPSRAQLLAGRLRSGLQAACAGLPAAPGGLLPGLVIGDTSGLDPGLAEEFRTTGLTHLVAVSGANVAIILSVVLFCARWCRAGPWVCAAVCALALVGFVILARPSPSVLRAAAMGAVALLALASGRARAAPPALATSVIVCLLVDPALAADPGFALSVLATGALVLLAPRWRDALVACGVPHGVAEAVAIPAAAQVACGPVIVALSGQISLVAVPANLLAAPAVAPATLFGVGAAVVSPLWSDAAAFLAWCASWPARYLVGLATVGAGIPAGAIPWPAGAAGGLALAGTTVGLLVASRRPVARRILLAATLAVAVGAMPVRWIAPGWPVAGAVIIACDVGQGDALVVPTAADEAVVVDTGPDPEAVDGCLRRLGIRSVAAIVITHFHADHIAGISGVLRGRRAGVVLLPEYTEPAAGLAATRAAAAAAGVVTATVTTGWTLRRGPVELRVIGPSHPATGTRSDPNNNSVLLWVVSAGVSMLLAGDAETEEQHELVGETDRAQLRADVLKVAHHGSLYQDPELLAAVDPVVALVSVGADNPYGHPNAAVLDALRRGGAAVLRTDLSGDIAVVRTGAGVGVAERGS